jgi:DNA-binding GntR family transcriptional regulator
MGTVVYESVRDAIIEGRYGADEKLVQEQVAGDLGVSRTPVRDALNRLAQEGLVTWRPGSGYLVNDLTDQDITEVFEVRRNLEVLALEKSCGRLSRVQASRINTIIEEMAAADPTDAAAQFDLNRRFHQAMIEPAGNQLLLTMLDQLWDHPVSRRITRSYIHDEENVGRMIEEHRQILQACLDDDVQRLTTLSAKHMTEGYGETLSEAT